MGESTLKILSIDFDYIMAPCIKLYNDLCTGSENPTVSWKIIEHERNIEPFLNYDAESLLQIAKIIKANTKNGAKFINVRDHQDIINFLPNDKMIDLTNIDFHHDILYNINSMIDITDMGKYNCSNWVYYLYAEKVLNSYTWVKAPQSDLLDPNIDFPNYEILTRTDLGKIKDDFDMVFFCLSPQWVPYKFHHLYDLITELCKEDVDERSICSK